jgi:hypothetical protein
MADRCHQELCPNWPGEGCLRGVLDCPDEADDDTRAYVSRQWADAWDSPEDAVYDEPEQGMLEDA